MFGDITTILTVYKRPEYLDEQIWAICNQADPPTEIWIWVNCNKEVSIKSSKYPIPIKLFYSSHNMKYHARFALGLLAKTEYVAVFDDDTIPGKGWFTNCLTNNHYYPGIQGGVGIRLIDRCYAKGQRFGWPSKNEVPEEVDLVGHAWFMKKDYLRYLWYEEPFSYETGEDIQLSYLAKKYGGIKSWCPPHPQDSPTLHSSLKPWEYGADDKASSNGSLGVSIPEFYKQRDDCILYALNNGWKTVLGVT